MTHRYNLELKFIKTGINIQSESVIKCKWWGDWFLTAVTFCRQADHTCECTIWAQPIDFWDDSLISTGSLCLKDSNLVEKLF